MVFEFAKLRVSKGAVLSRPLPIVWSKTGLKVAANEMWPADSFLGEIKKKKALVEPSAFFYLESKILDWVLDSADYLDLEALQPR